MSNVSRKRTAKMATLDMVRIAMLTAVSLVLMQFEIPIVAFYKLDFSNVPVLLGAFAMGPLNGLLGSAFEKRAGWFAAFPISGRWTVGRLHRCSGVILPAALIYRKNRTMKGAVIGMVVGTVCMAIMGAIMNYFVLIPAYCGELPPFPGFFSREAILGMFSKAIPSITSFEQAIILVTIPFNLFKGVVISVITTLLYKRVSPLLKKGR